MNTCQLYLTMLVHCLPLSWLLATDFHADLWYGCFSRLIVKNNVHVNLRIVQSTIHQVYMYVYTDICPLRTFGGLTSGVTSQVGFEGTLGHIADDCQSIIIGKLCMVLSSTWRISLIACMGRYMYLQHTVFGKLTCTCAKKSVK